MRVYGWGFAVLFLYKFPFLFGYMLYLFFGLFLAQAYYQWKKIYLVNRLETNCRKPLIPFHAIWGLCWYSFCLCFHFYTLVWTCRDKGLYAVRVQTWSYMMSKSTSFWRLQNVSALLFGAALVGLHSGLRLEYIWDSAVRFGLHESCCCQLS